MFKRNSLFATKMESVKKNMSLKLNAGNNANTKRKSD